MTAAVILAGIGARIRPAGTREAARQALIACRVVAPEPLASRVTPHGHRCAAGVRARRTRCACGRGVSSSVQRMSLPAIVRIRRAKPIAIALSAAVIIVASASASIAVPDSTRSPVGTGQWVEQIGTYDSLVSPDYDGLVPISAASSGATLGLGTFDQLDGEMVLVGGVIYRVGTDGVPAKVPASLTTPFFEGIRFQPELSGPVAPGTACANLVAAVNALSGSDSGIVAVRLRGTFTDLVTRSVPAQRPPFAPLSQVVAGQTVFPLGQRKAVLVGFRTAPDLAGTGAPGLHLHGLTADRSAGGHVLSCVAGSDVQLSVQRAEGVRIHAE